MRHNISRRIERLEQRNGTEKQKVAIIVRGNSPEEQTAEIERLKNIGEATDRDLFIRKPCVAGKPASEIIKLSMSDVHRMLKEIAGTTRCLPDHVKQIYEAPVEPEPKPPPEPKPQPEQRRPTSLLP